MRSDELGPLNRRGVLYRNTPTAGDGGAPVDVLTPLRSLYLTKEDDETSAGWFSVRIGEQQTIAWRSRWFDGLTNDMFITFEGQTFRIEKLNEIGRRHGWRIGGTLVK